MILCKCSLINFSQFNYHSFELLYTGKLQLLPVLLWTSLTLNLERAGRRSVNTLILTTSHLPLEHTNIGVVDKTALLITLIYFNNFGLQKLFLLWFVGIVKTNVLFCVRRVQIQRMTPEVAGTTLYSLTFTFRGLRLSPALTV